MTYTNVVWYMKSFADVCQNIAEPFSQRLSRTLIRQAAINSRRRARAVFAMAMTVTRPSTVTAERMPMARISHLPQGISQATRQKSPPAPSRENRKPAQPVRCSSTANWNERETICPLDPLSPLSSFPSSLFTEPRCTKERNPLALHILLQ